MESYTKKKDEVVHRCQLNWKKSSPLPIAVAMDIEPKGAQDAF